MRKIHFCLYWIDRSIEWVSSWALVLAVIAMLGISVLSIVLRWFSITFLWFEPFVRHVVFLSAFLGGVLATGRGTHIGIDILGKYLENHGKRKALHWLQVLISFVGTLTLVWLIYASWKFLKVEWQWGKEGFWGIHSSFLVAIIPFGFSLIAYRFFYRFIHQAFVASHEDEHLTRFEEGVDSTIPKKGGDY